MSSTAYAPEHWLGTRLAQELLGLTDPTTHLYTAQDGDDPLAKYAQITGAMILELDRLDSEAERLRQQLAHRAEHGSRYLDGPYRDGAHAGELAVRLEKACMQRDWATSHLRRLLLAYQAAAHPSPSQSAGNTTEPSETG